MKRAPINHQMSSRETQDEMNPVEEITIVAQLMEEFKKWVSLISSLGAKKNEIDHCLYRQTVLIIPELCVSSRTPLDHSL